MTSTGPEALTLEFEPAHASQIADELDRRALRLFEDPTETVTMYVTGPHYLRLHIAHPAHVATTLRRAAGIAELH